MKMIMLILLIFATWFVSTQLGINWPRIMIEPSGLSPSPNSQPKQGWPFTQSWLVLPCGKIGVCKVVLKFGGYLSGKEKIGLSPCYFIKLLKIGDWANSLNMGRNIGGLL